MGDFGEQTSVHGSDGRYTATLSRDWEIWGPNGGYVAAIALRAAGAASRLPRPASFACHYLNVAAFADVQIHVTPLRAAKRAESLRVSIAQGDRRILEAIVWTVDEVPGLEHDHAEFPDVPSHRDLRPIEELLPEGEQLFRFWDNFDRKPVKFMTRETMEPGEPVFREWIRFRPQATFADPFTDAARSLLLIDTMIWPAAWRANGDSGFVAPSLDCVAQFHQAAPSESWLLVDAQAPVARHGLIGGQATIWTEDGRLLASGSSQLLCRPAPAS